MNMHTFSRTFRQAFSFKPVMTELVSLVRLLSSKRAFIVPENGSMSKLLDKSLHFATLVCTDDSLDSSLKRGVS